MSPSFLGLASEGTIFKYVFYFTSWGHLGLAPHRPCEIHNKMLHNKRALETATLSIRISVHPLELRHGVQSGAFQLCSSFSARCLYNLALDFSGDVCWYFLSKESQLLSLSLNWHFLRFLLDTPSLKNPFTLLKSWDLWSAVWLCFYYPFCASFLCSGRWRKRRFLRSEC